MPSPTTDSEAEVSTPDSSGLSEATKTTESFWQTYLQSQERKLILPVSAVHSRASVEFLVHKLATQPPADLVLVLDQEEEESDISLFAEQVIPRSFVRSVRLVSPRGSVWSASGQVLPVLRALRTCRTLQELHLQGPIRPLVASQFGYALKEVLRSPVVALTRLHLDKLGEDFAKIAAEVGQGIQQCSTLKTLELSRCTVTPTLLRKLTYTRCRLTVLIFCDCQVPGADLAEAIRARQSREELQAILTQVVHHQDRLQVLDLSSLVAVQADAVKDQQQKQRRNRFSRPASALAMSSALKQALWAHPTLQVVNVCATLHVQDPHVTRLVDLYHAVAVVRRLHRRRARSAPPLQHQQVWIKPRPPPHNKKDQDTGGSVHLIVTPCDATEDDSSILASLVPRGDGEHEAQHELQRLVLHKARVVGQASGGQVRQVLELATGGGSKKWLKKLAFVECDMNAAALTEIRNGPLSALETLSFRRCSGLDENMLRRWLLPNTNAHLPLRHLTLHQMILSASSLPTLTTYLQQNTLLRTLNVSANPQLLYTPASAAVMRRRALGPPVDVAVRRDFFTAVASHPSLHTFAVSPTPGTGWHPSHHDTLAALRALFETLAQHASTSPLRELDLSRGVGCELDSSWVSQLSKLQNLRVLRLPRPLPRDNSRVALLVTALQRHLGLTELTWGEPHNHIYSQGTYEERMALKRILRRNGLIQQAAGIDDFNMLPAVWPRILARLAACGDGSAVFGVVRTHRSWYPVGQR